MAISTAHAMPALIAGRFSTKDADFLGKGGMGEVWKGLDTHTGEAVAIKIIIPAVADVESERVLARFISEAEALARLGHPNIVSLVANERDAEGRHYLIMKFEPGGSLREVLDARGRLPLREACVCACGAAAARRSTSSPCSRLRPRARSCAASAAGTSSCTVT